MNVETPNLGVSTFPSFRLLAERGIGVSSLFRYFIHHTCQRSI
jgi:hypothetical protein